jgi:hypothetical protein
VIDSYYDKNIKNSNYENYVLGVNLNVPTFSEFVSPPEFDGNAFNYGNGIFNWSWDRYWTDTRFATTLGGNNKQAFALSYGDIHTLDKSMFFDGSTGPQNDTGNYNFLLSINNDKTYNSFWLRSAGRMSNFAGNILAGTLVRQNDHIALYDELPVRSALAIQLD